MKRLMTAMLATLTVTAALAEYPEKPITIVVPFAAGGPTDKVARDLAEALRKPLPNATIVIDNTGNLEGLRRRVTEAFEWLLAAGGSERD